MFYSLRDKKVVLMGLGLYEQGSGISAAKFFIGPPLGPSLDHSALEHPQTRRAGRCRELIITDLKPAKELKKQIREIKSICPPLTKGGIKGGLTKVTWHLGGHRRQDFETADLIFQNPSVPADSPYLKIARQRRIPIVNDWSIFLLVHQPKMFIGVTGTRGKSTTTTLIYEMLKRKYKKIFLAGNIGRSPLTFIDSYRGEPIVAELSSWLLHHFPTAQKSPNIAVVTNIMKDHLDKYRNMGEYVADKENIFKFQKPGDVVVLNWDNPGTRKMGKEIKFQISDFRFQISNHKSKILNLKSKIIWFSLKKHLPRWVPLREVKLLGEHNLENILAAAAAAEAAGVPRRDILSVLRNFRGLPNRLELVRTVGGVKYYNDTTATTPDAAIAALEALGQIKSKILNLKSKIILIAGGSDKKLDYRELARHIRRRCKALVLLPGTATDKIRLQVIGYRLQVTEAPNMKEAVNNASALANKGDIVLLSPGAASFGLFKNEFERGEEFRRVVRQL